MAELTDDQIQAMRDAARDASIAAAQAFGFGGATWAITRYASDGVTAERTPASVGELTGYAYRQRPGTIGLVPAGAPVLDDIWRMIVVSVAMQNASGVLAAEDVLVSAADGRRVVVDSVEPWHDYQRCELRPW